MDIDIYDWRITAIEAVNADPPTLEHRRVAIYCGDSLLKLWLDDRKASELREALDALYPRILEPAPAPVEIDHEQRYADDHAGEFAEPNPNAPLPLTPADIEALQIEHTKKALDFIYASLNRTHEI